VSACCDRRYRAAPARRPPTPYPQSSPPDGWCTRIRPAWAGTGILVQFECLEKQIDETPTAHLRSIGESRENVVARPLRVFRQDCFLTFAGGQPAPVDGIQASETPVQALQQLRQRHRFFAVAAPLHIESAAESGKSGAWASSVQSALLAHHY